MLQHNFFKAIIRIDSDTGTTKFTIKTTLASTRQEFSHKVGKHSYFMKMFYIFYIFYLQHFPSCQQFLELSMTAFILYVA